MAIFEVTSTEVVQRCAKCDTQNRIPLTSLQAGMINGTVTDARVVPLPPCPTCKSVEFLVRSADGEPAHPVQGSFGHLHKMLVDHTHAQLITNNRVIAQLRDATGKPPASLAKPIATADRDRFFPAGHKIDAAAFGFGPKAAKETKDSKDGKDTKDTKDGKDAKDTKDTKDGKDSKDTKDVKDTKDSKDGKDTKDTKDGKDSKETKDTKEAAFKEKDQDFLGDRGPAMAMTDFLFGPEAGGESAAPAGRAFIRGEERPPVGERVIQESSQPGSTSSASSTSSTSKPPES